MTVHAHFIIAVFIFHLYTTDKLNDVSEIIFDHYGLGIIFWQPLIISRGLMMAATVTHVGLSEDTQASIISRLVIGGRRRTVWTETVTPIDNDDSVRVPMGFLCNDWID